MIHMTIKSKELDVGFNYAEQLDGCRT